MTFFGGGVQGSDPNLADKVAALKKKSTKQRVDEFLADELGVDPREVPFDVSRASDFFQELLDGFEWETVELKGNSMGLVSATFSGHDDTDETVTGLDAREVDWHDIERAWTALTKAHDGVFSFRVALAYPEVSVTPQPAPAPRHALLTNYPSGTILRVQRGEERTYVRIGGLFDDTTPTILEGLVPIEDPQSWTVVEELT